MDSLQAVLSVALYAAPCSPITACYECTLFNGTGAFSTFSELCYLTRLYNDIFNSFERTVKTFEFEHIFIKFLVRYRIPYESKANRNHTMTLSSNTTA